MCTTVKHRYELLLLDPYAVHTQRNFSASCVKAHATEHATCIACTINLSRYVGLDRACKVVGICSQEAQEGNRLRLWPHQWAQQGHNPPRFFPEYDQRHRRDSSTGMCIRHDSATQCHTSPAVCCSCSTGDCSHLHLRSIFFPLHDLKQKRRTCCLVHIALSSPSLLALLAAMRHAIIGVQVGRSEKPGALDDPTRPYIRFDIVSHLDTLSSHEHKRVCILSCLTC